MPEPHEPQIEFKPVEHDTWHDNGDGTYTLHMPAIKGVCSSCGTPFCTLVPAEGHYLCCGQCNAVVYSGPGRKAGVFFPSEPKP